MFSAEDVDCIYEVPSKFHKQGVDEKIAELLNIWSRAPELTGWEQVVERMRSPQSEVEIALVGKYVDLAESYKSLNEAIMHGGIANDCRVHLRHIDSEEIERKGSSCLETADGILVAPGFGTRGSEGKIEAARYAREKGVPYFGICLGLQIATIEFARNVAGLRGANSTEFEPKPAHPVIDFMPEQRNLTEKGATMRLGAYPCVLSPGTRAEAAYDRRRGEARAQRPGQGSAAVFRRARDDGKPPRPVRAVRGAAGGRRAGIGRGREPDDRTAQSSLLRRMSVPPRIQVETAESAPALPILHRRSTARPVGKAAQGACRCRSPTCGLRGQRAEERTELRESRWCCRVLHRIRCDLLFPLRPLLFP